MPTFFRQIIEAFLVRTEPDSSIVNPAPIHITSTPHTRNENVLRMNSMSWLAAGRVDLGLGRLGRAGQDRPEPEHHQRREGGLGDPASV